MWFMSLFSTVLLIIFTDFLLDSGFPETVIHDFKTQPLDKGIVPLS